MNTVDIKHLSFQFKTQKIFEDISISFPSGKIIGIVGKNGSGKSVFFKLLAGFLKPSHGDIWINGKNIAHSPTFAEETGILIEEPSFLPELSAYDNLSLLLSINHKVSQKLIEETLEKVDLLEHKNKKVKHFSLGMKKKIGIAQAIMENPKLLLLDEPMNALDTEAVEIIRNLLIQLAKEGTTIIMASHNQEDIQQLCHKVYRLQDYHLHLED